MKLPRAILFDLDDTILVAFGPAQSQWQRTIAAFADQLGPIEATVIAAAIEAASTEVWANPARYKYWRHRTGAARRRIVATAFAALAVAGHPVPPEAVGNALADAHNTLHDEELSLFPDAHETLDRLKQLGIKLALTQRGCRAPACQGRAFRPRTPFDHIQIEGEHGFGKPEERAYNHAMEVLGEHPRQFHAGAAEGSGVGGSGDEAVDRLGDLYGGRTGWNSEMSARTRLIFSRFMGELVSGDQRDRVMAPGDDKGPAQGRPVVSGGQRRRVMGPPRRCTRGSQEFNFKIR
jgi:putative hydrolase of the HAD superfamily